MSNFFRESGEYSGQESPGIDFASASRLAGGGSTCEIYKTRWQRREVFIKRLKPEFRSNPLYLDALDKEYDIGIRLHHPSLPEYREFHRDYIIIDYIDGITLREMLLRKDKWLDNKRNVTRLLRQLAEVLEYLHFCNIVHSDIKPDNILITSDSRNLILIDFDKSHTYSLNDSPGDPKRFGLSEDQAGKPTVDFYGMANVAEEILSTFPNIKDSRFSRFVKECKSPEADFETLKEILNQPHPYRRTQLATAAVLIIAIIAAGLWYVVRSTLNSTEADPAAEKETPELIEDSAKGNVEKRDADAGTEAYTSRMEVVREAAPEPIHETTVNYKSQETLHDEAAQRATLLDKRIQPLYDELLEGLDNLKQLKSNSTLTSAQLLTAIRKHGDKEEEYLKETFEIMKESFPGISDREAWRILSYSKAYTGYTRRATPELREFGLEIERRK